MVCSLQIEAAQPDQHEKIRDNLAPETVKGIGKTSEISHSGLLTPYPHTNINGVTVAVKPYRDGQDDPANIELTMSRGAKQRGARIIERINVTGYLREGRRITGLVAEPGGETGTITCNHVGDCVHMYGHDAGHQMGNNFPRHACEHFYIMIDTVPRVQQLPTLRVSEECPLLLRECGQNSAGGA